MKTRWYKNAVFYQIYPFSFMDSCDFDLWGSLYPGRYKLPQRSFEPELAWHSAAGY